MNNVKFDNYEMCRQLADTLQANSTKESKPFLIMSKNGDTVFNASSGTGLDQISFFVSLAKTMLRGIDKDKKRKLPSVVILKSLIDAAAEEVYGG